MPATLDSYIGSNGVPRAIRGVAILDVNGEEANVPVVNYKAPLTFLDVTIANAAQLSTVAQIEGNLVGIITPAAWTAADITFQTSINDGTYYPVYDGATLRTIVNATLGTNRFLALDNKDWRGIKYLKINSSVVQGGARTIRLVIEGA